ncbi:MAG: hypothetical protein JWO95_1304 [Verrucomicrobiales bacterium]|nr:hypothetical protein [Verrucomicrobiales bacterium]
MSPKKFQVEIGQIWSKLLEIGLFLHVFGWPHCSQPSMYIKEQHGPSLWRI